MQYLATKSLGCGVFLLTALYLGSFALAEIPKSGTLVWASNRQGGRHEIYLMRLDGSEPKKLTSNGGTFPLWSPDGKWISFHGPGDEGYLIRPDGSGEQKICDGTPMFWHPKSHAVACDYGDRVTLVMPETKETTLLYNKSDFAAIADADFEPSGITNDGRFLLGWTDRYGDGFKGSNGYYESPNAAVVLDFNQKDKLFFFGSGCEPTTPPQGNFIYHVRGDGPTSPDIYRMNINDLATRSSYKAEINNADGEWGHEYFPRISNDNQWLTFAATTGCHDQDKCDYEIFIHRLGNGSSDRTRLTTNTANDQWPHLYIPNSPTSISGSDNDNNKNNTHNSNNSNPITSTSAEDEALTGCSFNAAPANGYAGLIFLGFLAVGLILVFRRRF